ncbi:16S rRNA C967 or C1407 C5-methylase (RsmB/RsmF family)/NOL1/NOP2/fmu family ribosome biogenesis protein [Parabacteroides sp. PFB2-12]|nr:16S rRNA C967 or C1407 C5-methylase (RsmB/RsmF family)/NOL1/NOP2/fmu family ribosome biogenesis protein [Parabacteroides sp. PM6-13]MDH6391805.1 16S rRNA C967 or C1407 C5-methylase (RsmB/RsmF family)/NOL1/NOP2/fmu family ribosome biogenesis protein [Parabacteroides sp. PFB2-12]
MQEKIDLPADFVKRMKELLSDEFPAFEEALNDASPVSIRINPDKQAQMPDMKRIPWTETGYYLPERLSFTFDPLFHAGTYYVQEPSSMFLEQAIRQWVDRPVCCLDLCAAPGGKSTHLAAVLPEDSLLVSNEVIRSRSHILAENIAKWGNPNSIVTNNDPEEIARLGALFDVIVADVPCSGEGMFRKDPASIAEWSVANVALCAARQRRIVGDIWEALKPGGLLIYSTCTYNTEENEENIHFFAEELGAECLSLTIPEAWQVTGALIHDHPVYRFLPHKTQGEGFFLAVMRKPEGDLPARRPAKGKEKREKNNARQAIPPQVREWINDIEAFELHINGDIIRAVPTAYKEEIQLLTSKLRTISAGITLGEVKGKDIIPAHALALSVRQNKNLFPITEVSWEEAIAYLKKEILVLPPEAAKGYHLISYKGHPLGFVKNIGNRANNLYPQEWRIRSGYIPEEIRLFPA